MSKDNLLSYFALPDAIYSSLLRHCTPLLTPILSRLGSVALERLQAIVSKQKADNPEGKSSPARPDYYTILRDNHLDDEVLERFWDELHSVPAWVDWEQIERAQKFFGRYAVANSAAFALQGFVRENSVSSPIS